VPSSTAFCGSLLVAAMMRHVDLAGLRRADPQQRAALEHAQQPDLQSAGISVTSSRNRVPPFARSKKPMCWRSAPVKLPFSWPNSSLSISFGEMAPQLTARKCSPRPPAQVVDGLRDDFLAGAALAGDQHRSAGRETRDIRS
jgi:hypothetical protein